jgi:hypothetical protein
MMRSSREAAAVNKLFISIHCRASEIGYDVVSSLKEPGRTAAVVRLKSKVPRIIPGDWGKAGSGWLARSLQGGSKGSLDEAGFTSSSGGVRAPSVTRIKETGGQER